MEQEKKGWLSVLILGLIIISLIIVGFVALSDALMTPAGRYSRAVQALEEGQYQKAERGFLLVQEGTDESLKTAAAYYLGQMYARGGTGFPIDGAKAALFYEKAANAGLADAQYHLALMYDTGDKIPENRAKALAWMNEAAKQGVPDALYAMGVWIERGYMGDTVPTSKVVALYEAAAAQGQKNAMTSLVNIYEAAAESAPQNAQKAAYWRMRLEQERKTKGE